MKRFLTTILLVIVIPLLLLAGIYLWTDPFRCIHTFDINDVDVTNREYISTELFLRNNPTYHYNSFIFSSSRGGGMNTYQWKLYLPEGAQPYLFQAWGESLTGMEMKLEYLDEHDIPIDNVLLLIDIPGTFRADQLSYDALSMKHYMFTGQSKFIYNVWQYLNFIQKPSLWGKSVKNRLYHKRVPLTSDTITNDWERDNRFNYMNLPSQDSLRYCTEMTRRSFLAKMEHSNKEVKVSKPLISEQFESQLCHIKDIFDAKHTDYYIIITPAPCYTNPTINPFDLIALQEVFGKDRVHNYSGKNEMTCDYNNFSDPAHFGSRSGFIIIKDIYEE